MQLYMQNKRLLVHGWSYTCLCGQTLRLNIFIQCLVTCSYPRPHCFRAPCSQVEVLAILSAIAFNVSIHKVCFQQCNRQGSIIKCKVRIGLPAVFWWICSGASYSLWPSGTKLYYIFVKCFYNKFMWQIKFLGLTIYCLLVIYFRGK